MITASVSVEGMLYGCEARPYSWSLGLGVDVAIFRERERIACVRILCPMDFEEYDSLTALQETERVQLALDRFIQEQLNVTPASLLESQRKIHSVAGSGPVAIIASFKAAPDKKVAAFVKKRGA